jgi:class 3 adenylate cyclase
MDIHSLPEGTTMEDIAKAHAKDMETQRKYGVEYSKYWVNESGKKLFCLCHAPNAEAAECVHREAHGMMAEKIIEIQPEVAEGFLGGTETNDAGAVVLPGGADTRDPGIRTVLFTDVVNSTTLTQSLGDEAALALLGVHDAIVRDALSALGGREIKHTGDGIMASFDNVANSVLAAADIQRRFAAYNADVSETLSVRIGIDAGEPVEDHNDLFGSTVQLASRLCSEAEANGIIVSGFARELCQEDAARFVALGERRLRGFADKAQVFRFEWRD